MEMLQIIANLKAQAEKTGDEQQKSALLHQIGELEKAAAKPAPQQQPAQQQQQTPPANGFTLADIQAAVRAEVEPVKNALAAEVDRREKAEQSVATQQKKQLEEKIKGEVEAAVTAGKITPEQKESWSARLTGNYDGFSQVLAELPAPAGAKTTPKPGAQNGQQAGGNGAQNTQQEQTGQKYESGLARGAKPSIMSHVMANINQTQE